MKTSGKALSVLLLLSLNNGKKHKMPKIKLTQMFSKTTFHKTKITILKTVMITIAVSLMTVKRILTTKGEIKREIETKMKNRKLWLNLNGHMIINLMFLLKMSLPGFLSRSNIKTLCTQYVNKLFWSLPVNQQFKTGSLSQFILHFSFLANIASMLIKLLVSV